MFWFSLLLISLPIFVLLVLPWLKKGEGNGKEIKNKQLLSNRLHELEREHRVGWINHTEYQEMQQETRQAFALQATATAAKDRKRHIIFALLLMIVSVAGGISVYVNTSDGYHALLALDELNDSVEQLLTHITELEQQLQDDPHDAKSWGLLANARLTLGQYAAAAQAYAQIEELEITLNEDTMLRYAKALVLSEDKPLKAQALLDTVLRVDAENDEALFLYGVLKFNRSEYQQAVQKWEALYNSDTSSMPEDMQAMLVDMIDEARQRALTGTNKQDEHTMVLQVMVTLDTNLTELVVPEDIVFIYVRAPDGPPMPLLARRLKVSDLPAQVELSDSDAMVAGTSLTNFAAVSVFARVAKSGLARAQAGDLIGSVMTELSPGISEISVVINEIVE